jgi:hypothetical protein
VSPIVRRALAIAHAEVGYVEQGGPDGHSGNITKYGKALHEDGVFWCAEFAWWVWWKAGFDLRTITPLVASAEYLRAAFERHGALHRTPLVGDLPIYHFPGENDGPSRANHIGAVITAVHGQYDVEAIEGNTNNAGSSNGGEVMRKHRRAGLVGYGRVTDLLPPEQRPRPAPARVPTPRRPATPSQSPHVQEDDDMAQVITADGVALYVATARHGARHITDQLEAGAQVAAGLITLEQLHHPVRVTPAQLQALTAAASR